MVRKSKLTFFFSKKKQKYKNYYLVFVDGIASIYLFNNSFHVFLLKKIDFFFFNLIFSTINFIFSPLFCIKTSNLNAKTIYFYREIHQN